MRWFTRICDFMLLNDELNQKDTKVPTQVTFRLNFFDELRNRVPVGK